MTHVDDGPPPGFFDALLEDDPTELYEMAPCGYVSIGDDRRILKANRTFCNWTGYDAEKLVGRNFLSLLTVGDRIFWETNIAPALELQQIGRELAVDVVCATGDHLPVLLNLLGTQRSDGSGVVRIAVFDARERRSYEQELLRTRREAEEAGAAARLLAETLQRTLLPPSLPDIQGLEIGVVYHPSGDGSIVGGDFYDVFETAEDGTWGVVLGDVCGKGPEAAVDTALARYTVRAAAIRSWSPSRVLMLLHDAIERSDTQGFCTAVYIRLRHRGDGLRLSISVGGHHLPLLVSPGGDVEPLGKPGALLGMLGPPRLHDVEALLEPGDTLVLFTDGVIEARRDDDFFGEERLLELLQTTAGSSVQAVAEAIVEAALDFQRSDARDDIAVLVLRATDEAFVEA